MVTTKNACLYNPKKKGMIASIILSIGQIGSPIFAVVAESIINPRSVIIPTDNWIFPSDISENFFSYLKMIYFIYPVGTIITLLTFIKYDDSKKDEIGINIIGFTSGLNDNPSEKKSPKKPLFINGQRTEKYKSDIRKIFKSRRIYMLCLIYFLSSFLFFLITSTSKTIGSLKHFNTDLLKYSSMVGGISLLLLGPVWGYLYDKFHFKILVNVVNGAGVFIGPLIIAALIYDQWLFAVMTIVNGFFFIGMMNIFNPHIMKIYTIEYSMEIAGIMVSAGGFSNVIGSIFAFVVSKILSDEEKTQYAYIAIYSAGSFFNLVSLFVSRYENDIPFDFNESSEEKLLDGKPFKEVDLGIN